jgi:hypothetical protein
MKRWVGLGVIADNLVNISRAMTKQPGPWAGPSACSQADKFLRTMARSQILALLFKNMLFAPESN